MEDKLHRERQRINQDFFNKFKGLSFAEFNELIGLPQKNDKKYPIFQYEYDLLDLLNCKKHVWVKKATGLGITEFTLRWIAWMSLKDNTMKEKHKDVDVIVITGPRIELAIGLIDRLKGLFYYDFETKNTVCILNGVRIEAFPSHHLHAARGLNPQVVFLDEADFFPLKEQVEARSISERYIAKTNPWILMVSTPNNPGGLYESIEKEKKCLYERIFLDYKIGLRDKMFTVKEIQKARESPTFEREYNLQYGVGSGNIFQGIDDIIEEYDLKITDGKKALFCDPAYGSSKFGIIGIEELDGIMYVKEATQYERPSPSAMLDIVIEKAKLFDSNVYVDAAHPGLIRDLIDKGITAHSVKFGQKIDGKEAGNIQSLLSLMTIEAAQAVKEKRIKIHSIFTDLIAQLKSVQFNERGHPDKRELTFDLGDCFLMSCMVYKNSGLKSIKIS